MDSYFKKEIAYTFKEKEFKFDVGETLFSTFAIDHDTDILGSSGTDTIISG